jgi:NTE family protein
MSALLLGLEAAGLRLGESDAVLGTSAGGVVGAWLTMDPDGLASVPERMRARASWHAKRSAGGGHDPELFRKVVNKAPDDTDAAAAIGQAAIAAVPPISAAAAESMWTANLPAGSWPERLGIVSVNAETGRPHTWRPADGIPLAVAIACTSAAPGAAPPVRVGDGVWVDGGVRSGTNADLLLPGDPGRVLIVAPIPADNLARERAALVAAGFDVRVVVADRFYSKPTDMLDPGFIDVATAAGARQAEELGGLFGS